MDLSPAPLSIVLSFFLLVTVHSISAQANLPEKQHRHWDIGVRVAGATGEENTNSFSEAQILTGSFFVGKEMTDEIGNGWRRGHLEYGFDVMPLFRQFQLQSIHPETRTPDLYRVNSEVNNLKPFACLAFPCNTYLKTPKNSLFLVTSW